LKTFKTILAGTLFLALAFFAGWFGHSWFGDQSKPTPTPAPIVNPVVNPDDDNQNQVVVEIGGTGTTSQTKNDNKKTVTKKDPGKIIDIIKDITKTITGTAPAAVPIDKTMPVTGTITAKFIDKKSNTDLGSETKPLTGTATVKGTSDAFNVQMDFSSELTFGVTIPQEVDKLWHVGLYAAAVSDGLGVGGFTQRDFKLATYKNIDLIGFGRVEIDREPKMLFGVEADF
jgi:hypothetical protein